MTVVTHVSKLNPAVTSEIGPGSPTGVTSVAENGAVVPIPSSPWEFDPQQLTEFACVRMHACAAPSEICATPVAFDTSVGVALQARA